MKRTLALIAAACIATPAMAWGEREQGALAGIAALLIFQHVQRDAQTAPPPVVHQPQPQIIYAPPPVVSLPPRPIHCHYRPLYDQWGYYRGEQRICY